MVQKSEAGQGTKPLNQTFYRLRLIVLVAITTGMRAAEIFGLRWSNVKYSEGLIAIGAKLKGGKMRYVPMLPELASQLRRYPVMVGEDRIFPPKAGANGERQRVEGSFEDLLERADIEDFRFHDMRHTFASWYMMNGGDLYELEKILGPKTGSEVQPIATIRLARVCSLRIVGQRSVRRNTAFASASGPPA